MLVGRERFFPTGTNRFREDIGAFEPKNLPIDLYLQVLS